MHSTSAALLFVLVATARLGRTICQTYDCSGSSLCSHAILQSCDQAVNDKLVRNDVVNYGAPGSNAPDGTGACAAPYGASGCGVFIQGPPVCTHTGNEIWYDYQDIRSVGCEVCGSKHWGPGCLTTINYISECD